MTKSLSPKARNLLVNEVLEQHQPITGVSQKFGVSRVTAYKWIKRAKEGQDLLDKERKIDKYWRQTPEKHEQAILSIVAKHPEWGIRTLVKNLPKVGHTPVVGHHGVQNVLRRNNLLHFEDRLAYAKSLRTPVLLIIEKIIAQAGVFFRIPAIKRHSLVRWFLVFGLSMFVTVAITGVGSYVYVGSVGTFFALTALVMGSFFFLYSLKYYITLAIVLSYSQGEGDRGQVIGNRKNGFFDWLLGNHKISKNKTLGLEPNLDNIVLKEKPFVSIHIPFYNEKNVADRSIHAATSFDYPEYEVILCDDSTDETTQIIRKRMERYLGPTEKLKFSQGENFTLSEVEVRPGVTLKHLHRSKRDGFKGAALKLALTLTNKKAEYISVFDADFVPYPDTLSLFLKYFQASGGNSNDKEQITKQYQITNEQKSKENCDLNFGICDSAAIAAVQGYQWHVLNKSENWITRGVRSEYSGSYVIERAGAEIYGGLKQISGSVYMIKRKVLESIGWGTSITEDFQLTLNLYNQGYKVAYTPYVQAPAECVSTLQRLIRQRMRWAEGHSQNIKKMFKPLMTNPKLTGMEKLEFLYLSPYYLQAFFFLVGTLSWLISETIFKVRLPFWTELWGWSLVLTNMISLPLVNAVGLFLEESDERDYMGLGSFIALSYILVPFQAYASVKGFLEKQEGGWFRTPKSGLVTDTFTRGRFYRFIQGIMPKAVPSTQYLVPSLTTANNVFNKFNIKKAKNKRWVGKMVLVSLLLVSLMTSYFAAFIPETTLAQTISISYKDKQINKEKKDIEKMVKVINPEKKKFGDKEVELGFTDENSDENLIIKVDKKTYTGLASADVYFSVTNEAVQAENINFQAHFPDNMGNVESVSSWNNSWEDMVLSKKPIREEKQTLFQKILDTKVKRKKIPQSFKVKKSTVGDEFKIDAGETKYFKMGISFPPRSSGEFLIEAIGDIEGYGLLDPWWSSSWAYKKSITIDHDRVGIIADLSSNASSGQKNVVVDNGSLFTASETVLIKDDNNEETATISSVSSNTLTMQDNLTNSYTTTASAFVKNTTDSSDLTDFPVLIDLASDSDLVSDAQDDGDDIAFTSSGETTQLDHEIENFNGTTGELQAWVEIPTLSAVSDTVLYMYYGNGSCETQENIVGTWESNFKLVHHLNDVTTSTTEDSTSNNNDATKKGANEPAETDGKIGKAQDFDGTDDYSSISNTVVASPASLTISSWFKKPSDGSSYECALHHGSDTSIGNSAYWLGVDIDNRLTATIGARTGVGWSAGQTTTTATYGEWYHLAASWDGSVVRIYINGVYNKQYNLGSYSNLTTATRFGASSDGSNYQFKGIVDEVRISTAYRGPDWIKTSYNNQNSPSSFYSLGTEEGKPLLLEQSHYHWRNDDGSESTATSATSGSEDTVLSIDSDTRKRVRVEISNEGSENSTDVQYRLEYGEKSTTCSAISSWVDVGAVGGDWDISASDNLTDGNDTTNIAESIGGVTDENTTFETPNAAVKDTSSQTGNISLSTSDYVEIEYSIVANSSAVGKNYCFRLTDAGSTTSFVYSTYAEAGISNLEQIHYRWRNDDGGEGDTTSWYNASWPYRKKITIDHTKVEDDHADFPILVYLNSSETDFWSHCSNESEIVFTQSDGTTKLKREVETFDHTNDDLYAWVKIPTMDKDEDLEIYLYYGNGSASETDDADTWDSDFKLVQHLNDLTTSTTEDSTSNNNDAVKRAANEPIETNGKIGKAQDFDGSNDYDKISNNFITTPSYLTISSWIKKESDGTSYECALHKASGTTIGSSDYWLGVSSDDFLTATIGANQSGIGWDKGKTTTTVNYGQWYHLAASWSGSVVKVYINGEYDKQYNLTSYGNLTTPTRFGASSDGSNYQFKGIVDEIRISTAFRGDNWIKTSYNNQNDPTGFYVVGNEQIGVGASWAKDQDTKYENIPYETTYRLRFEVSNEGNQSLEGVTYQLQVAETVTCSTGSYVAVPTDLSGDWQVTTSSYIADGQATSNVSGGLDDEATTFVAGEAKDGGNTTSLVTLASDEFTEIEFAVQATTNATNGGNYCFRLYDTTGDAVLDSYTNYAQATVVPEYLLLALLTGPIMPFLSKLRKKKDGKTRV